MSKQYVAVFEPPNDCLGRLFLSSSKMRIRCYKILFKTLYKNLSIS